MTHGLTHTTMQDIVAQLVTIEEELKKMTALLKKLVV